MGPGMNGSNFNPSNAGVGTHTITYSYTDGNGCSASDQVVIMVDNCVELDEVILDGIILYPNPNEGRFTLSKRMEGAQIKIFSIEGKLMFSNLMTEENEWIDISNVESGVYMLKISYKEYEKTLSFIKR